MSDKSFYNKINQVALKELIDFMEHNKTEIVLKVFDQYIKTNIHSKKNDKSFALPKFNKYSFSNEVVTCIFQVKDERYFFKSHLNNTTTEFTLDIPTEVFKLQRRNDYRISMPIGVSYSCEIQNINGRRAKIKTEIRDISLGGCQLSINGISSDINAGDELIIYLKLNKFEFQKLKLTAKHIKFIDSQNSSLIGTSLLEPASEVLAELQALLMHLDRVQRGKAD